MDQNDWHLLGHELFGKRGQPVLPTRRLDIPLPEDIKGLYEVSQQLGYLSQELIRITRLSEDACAVLTHADALLRLSRQHFVEMRAEWQTVMRERIEAAQHLDSSQPPESTDR